ncbi:type II secretion system protein GspL [Thiomicrospira cyclica]|uniref:Type II secretion system protein L n=1 Tax=Thiomicrospira cyclica (strain DSM 14477 / JCM 11371 / ALM1) TaxID=717773 RepID=F6DD29_THICA|nr:type II secretion system protein GspL [Thiomicrospira cyclica]AEG31765.1 General secretion pathway L [Thiomicrospira cyclica ALM1]
MNSYFDLNNQLHSILPQNPSAEAANSPIIVWVPSVRVTILQGFVPGKSCAQWQAALPYAFEEQIAQPIEEVHFALIQRDKAGLVTVAVVAKQQLQLWIDGLAQAGLEQAWLVPECFRLPVPDWKFKEAGDSQQAGYFAPSNIEPETYIARASFGLGFSFPQAHWSGFLALYPSPIFTPQDLTGGGNPCDYAPFNLRQGDYAPKRHAKSSWRVWRWSAGLAAAWLSLLLGQMLLETQQSVVQAQNMQQQTESLFRQAMPESQRIVNIQVQTQSFLNQSSAQGVDFAPVQILARIEPFILAQPGIQTGRFDWQNQTLSLALTAGTTEQLDQLLMQVNEALPAPLQARLLIRQVVADKVEAHLNVTAH